MNANQTICESGMHFPYNPGQTFLIEKYVQGTGLQHVKSVEFIRPPKKGLIWLVEAKPSAPNPASPSPENFNTFINDIAQKAIDSFSILFSIITARRNVQLDNPPDPLTYLSAKYCLVLVIKNHKSEWLEPVRNALQERLRHFYTAWDWGSCPVLVLNEAMALRYGLICSRQTAQAQNSTVS